MPFTKQPNGEPIPGYRLLTPLGSGGFGEVWKCEAPGGLFKAIKFVYGNLNGACVATTAAHEELQAIQYIKDLRHPFLLSIDRVECVAGELMIVTELADKNLYELLLEYQQKGQPGVPREQLLHYLREAAEVLDLMNVQHGLQHLDVKPRNFFVVSNHVKVADFGLVTNITTANAGVKLGAVTPLYAAPEVFTGKVSPTSDQYSLAVCFIELLTGKLPFDGRNSRQLLLQHLNEEPDLSALPEADRPILARALAKDPSKRYPSCLALIQALAQGVGSRGIDNGKLNTENSPFSISDHPTPSRASVPEQPPESMRQTLNKKLTDTEVMRFSKAPPALPAALAGYKFLENQASSLLADVWKTLAPDGRLRQVKFIYGFAGRDSNGMHEAVRRLQALQHPGLAAIEVVQVDPGCLVLVNDLAKETLRDRWLRCQTQRLPGIPRSELLRDLRMVAEVMDYLYQQHAISHLGLNPRNLEFVDGGLQVAEFGLAHLFWAPTGQPLGQRNARYAAPELFDQQVHRASDQFSLAVMFQELLTGVHPFAGHSRGSSAIVRSKLKPNLARLPAADQDAIARALDADPQQRWPSCCEFVQALEDAASSQRPAPAESDSFTEFVAGPRPAVKPRETNVNPEALNQILNDLLAQVGGTPLGDDAGSAPTLSEAGDVLTHRFRAGLPIGAARVKVDKFRQQVNGQLLRDEETTYDFHVATPSNFWQQWMGRQAGLDVNVELTRPHALSATPIDVTLTIKAVRAGKKKAAQLVEEVGTSLLEGLRAFLLTNSEKRTQERLMWPHPVQVSPVEEDGTVGPPITCRGKDISLSGIGFYLPHQLPTAQVVVCMPALANTRPLNIPATLVRAQRCADGWYDVGALFLLATLRKNRPKVCKSRK